MSETSSLYPLIEAHIPNTSRVLDLGCGKGALLSSLHQHKQIQGYGVELEYENVLSCIEKGLSVFQGNITEILTEFTPNTFDIVILSQTLQEVYDPVIVLKEILRIGKKAIITFPNFGHWWVRSHLLIKGYSPKTQFLPYEWYNTPNIRVITINDFRHLCREHDIDILVEQAPLTLFGKQIRIPKCTHNLFSPKALFVLQKKHAD